MKRFYFFIFCLIILFIPLKTLAFEFNPNNIITDFELKDKDSMSLSAIQAFLNHQDSLLKDLTFNVGGKIKTAAEIIYQASQKYFISPKFILTKLDHEQCLIRGCAFLQDAKKRQRALDWACGFSVCDNCNGSGQGKYRGFANQVDALASVQNDYIRKAKERDYIYQAKQNIITKDGYQIKPENQATANLYTYTPYHGSSRGIGGNYLFAKLWDTYWGSQIYPNGTVLKDEQNYYWLIDGGTKRRYASFGIFLSSHNPKDAISVSNAVLESYQTGPEIKFANYSLVKDETGKIYLLVDGHKRPIQGKDTFRCIGFHPEEVQLINSREISNYKLTVPITEKSIYPQGALLKNQADGNLYWVQNGFRYPVYADVALLNYGSTTPIIASAQEVSKYYLGDPQKIDDGKFVKSSTGDIYLVSQGVLRPIPSQSDFINIFGQEKWNQVSLVSDKTLALHELGDPVESKVYERNIPQVAGEKVENINYKVVWLESDVPNTLIAGKIYNLSVSFKNKSSDAWDTNSVLLKLLDYNLETSNKEPVLKNGAYSFLIPFNCSQNGEQTLVFKLYNQNQEYITGGFYQIDVKVIQPEYQAKIVSNSLPIALRNDWSHVPVEIKVVNTGSKPWTRRKTGLKFLSANGHSSVFYDQTDWLDQEIASVSLDPWKKEIASGEESVFKFTLDPKGVSNGVYEYRLELWMSDQDKIIYLDGLEYFTGQIRVDNP